MSRRPRICRDDLENDVIFLACFVLFLIALAVFNAFKPSNFH
jgi:hypothetical protein